MPLLLWNDHYATGDASIDHEHRELIDLVNRLHATLVEEGEAGRVSRFFGELHAAIAAHFALEERLMRERRYDGYGEHKADHERLLDEIRDIMDDYESDLAADYRGRLAERLDTWFDRHFRTLDARLHRVLGPTPGGPPPSPR